MSDVWRYPLAIIGWPGILSAAILGWFYLWIARKLTARLQGRQGPPFFQPFFDFVKLLGKRAVAPVGVGRVMFYALPVASLASTTFALVLLPLPGNPLGSFPGDLVLLVYLLEVPVLCDVLAGYVSRSIYGEVSAMREAILSLGYNLPFLAAVIALAEQSGTYSLDALHAAPFGPVSLFAAVGFLLAIPAQLKSNPFSIPNAEQEIVAGAHIEYNAAPLAIFELSHALEIVLFADLFVILFVPPAGSPLLTLVTGGLASLGLVAIVTLLAATTARLKLAQAFRFYWMWGGLASVGVLVAALVW